MIARQMRRLRREPAPGTDAYRALLAEREAALRFAEEPPIAVAVPAALAEVAKEESEESIEFTPALVQTQPVAHVARLAVAEGHVTCQSPDDHMASAWTLRVMRAGQEGLHYVCAICVPPDEACPACHQRAWWRRPVWQRPAVGDTWCCGICHAAPEPDEEGVLWRS